MDNMNKDLGVGIVGLGWVSAQYIHSFIRNKNCDITALCTRDFDKGQSIVEKYNLNKCEVFTRLETMLEDGSLDIVCILTPNFLHLDQATKCAESGKHIILEKPVALNLKEAQALNATVQKYKVKSIVGFVLRWNSLFKNIKAMIDRGVIGEIFHIEIDYMFHLDQTLNCYGWCSKKALGGSVLIQSGCHAVDGLCYFAGKRVKELIAISSKNRDDFDHDTTYSIMVRFENGSTGKIFCTYDTLNPYVYNIQIFGKNGSIRNNTLYSESLFPGQNDWITIPSIMPDTENVEYHPFPDLVDHFVDCVKNNVDPKPGVGDVMHVFEIIEAAEQSAINRGTWVEIPFE
jgi:predicted dehydrogenase